MAWQRCLLLAAFAASSGAVDESESINPVRRVVNMLQMMQKKITAEGEQEAELMEKFFCYCETGGATLQKSIADAEALIPELTKKLEAFGAEVIQLTNEIEEHKKDRVEAKAAIVAADEQREEKAAKYAEYKAETDKNLQAMAGAITALEKGMGSSFLQSTGASVLKNFALTANILASDRDSLTSFLTEDSEYAPQSGEITGILKQMHDTLSADSKAAADAEAKSIKAHGELVSAKKAEIEASSKQIEEKMERVGTRGVEVVNMKEQLEDTKEGLEQDKKFLEDLAKNCATKKDEWAERQKLRSEELLALADTIKILNDDDALDLFKKTLATPPAFLQMESHRQRTAALEVLKANDDPRMSFITAMLTGRKKISFEKVIALCDDLLKTLTEEQATDEAKKAQCDADIDAAEDEEKQLNHEKTNLEAKVEELVSDIANLKDNKASLESELKNLDKQVAEETEQRKAEAQNFKEETVANTAAQKLLEFAKNRLNKFYNPKLYKPPPKQELSEADRIAVNMGGDAPTTAAPGGIAGTGITALDQVAPGPAPEVKFSSSKGEMGNGVIAMIDTLIKEISAELTTSKAEEQNAITDFAKFTQDAATKKANLQKELANTVSQIADATADLEATKETLATTNGALAANVEKQSALHSDCDWLLKFFDLRTQQRTKEIENVKKAKDILSGANFSLLQQKTRRNLRHTRIEA